VLGIGFAQELPGHFILALYEAKGTLTEVVGRRDGEIPDPFRLRFTVFEARAKEKAGGNDPPAAESS
jgi:hypothetical protein